jgi:hypothetical protein
MVKSLFCTIFAVLVAVLSGCIVQSIQPFYTEESVMELSSIEGKWRLVTIEGKGAEKQERPWEFTKDEIETYDGDISSRIKVMYFRVLDAVLADVTVAPLPNDQGPNVWWTIHVMPVHSLWRVDLSGDSLALTPLNYTWMRNLLAKKKTVLSHTRSDDKDFRTLLTGSSKELTAFLQKNVTNPSAFIRTESYVFERVKEEKGETRGRMTE